MTDDRIRLAKEAANRPGFGTGAALRERIFQEDDAINHLPDPAWMMPVVASADLVGNALVVCSFGNSVEDPEQRDWYLIADGQNSTVPASEAEFPADAMLDARAVAAVLNAWRMGLLVCPSRTASDARTDDNGSGV
jgi:hypothetical protein